jgi:Tol biopolymer transport system component/TolB-like protein/Tfp pilus assembly protein PilF
MLVAIIGREPVPLPRYRPEVPTELEWIIKKALRKDRDERYQTIREFLADLKNLGQRLDFEQELERSLDTSDSRAPYSAPESQSKSSSTAIDSLAIVPFQHHDPEPGMEYFSDGIAETMITTLSRLPELRVMAWSTVSQYKGQQVDPRRVGRELGVRAVVTGRIVQSTDSLVMKLELVDGNDGSQLWSDQCVCNPANVLDVGTQISCELSERLLLRLTNEERNQLARHPTDNVEAYHSYLKGRYCWNKRTDEDVRNAIEYFKKAIDADPTYALAYIGLADCYLILGSFGVATLAPRDAFPKAREALERAIAIDDTLAEAHASLGYCLANYDWNWTAAEREFKRALELKPDYAVAHHWYGFIFLTPFARLDEAIAELRQALDLDPLSLSIGSNVGLLFYLARRHEEALTHFQRHLEMDRNFVYTHWEMGLAYEESGKYDEAITAFRKAISLSGTSTLPRSLLARTYALAARKSEALTLIDQLNELSIQQYVSPYRIAAIYAALGDKDRAFKWLDHAYEARDGWLIWLAVDPVVDSLRSDPRFNELLPKIGLPVTSGQPDADVGSSTSTQIGPQSFVRQFAGLALVLLLVVLPLGAGYLLLKFVTGRTANRPQPVSFQQLTYQSGPEFFPSLSPDGKATIYASRASGNWDIYSQRVGDANTVNLTKDFVSDDSQPAFSPDGQRIAFRSERDGGGIYVMNANGDSPVRVSDFGYSPSWSRDGGQILVGTEKIPQPSTRPTKSQLWLIDLTSGQRQRISEGDALQPTSSPHHKRIAYWSRPDRYGQREHIWTIPVSGGEPVAVTDGSSTDLNPVWSPDGKYLYFSSNRSGSSNIWRVLIDEDTGAVMSAPEAVTSIGAATSVLYLSFSLTGQLAYSAQTDIRNLRRVSFDPSLGISAKPVAVTEGSLQFWFPDVSPDGEWLTAYSMGQQRHIYIMRTDGTNQRDLTPDTYRHAWPRWSPDGQRIAFTSRRTGDYEVWMVNRDGSNLHQVSQSNGGHYSPWSIDGSMIAYSIHAPKNDCVIINPDKAWGEQKFVYLAPLSDASLSFEGWSWSTDGKKLAGIRHLPNGVHSGIGVYDLETRTYDWLTDFGDWPIWLKDNRHLLFVSQGTIYLFDTASRKYRQIFEVTDQDVDIGSPTLSRDNRTLYFTYVAAEADIWLTNVVAK